MQDLCVEVFPALRFFGKVRLIHARNLSARRRQGKDGNDGLQNIYGKAEDKEAPNSRLTGDWSSAFVRSLLALCFRRIHALGRVSFVLFFY